MNLRVAIMVACLSLLTLAVTRNNHQLDPTNYLEYQASHGGSSWRGRAPVNHVAVRTKDEWLELNVIVKPAQFDSGHLMRDGLASALVFESKTYPDIVFTASVNVGVLEDDLQQIHLTGTLTMHSITKEVTTLINLEWYKTHLLATGLLEIKLSDYHMTRPLVAGFPIDDVVTITFTIELDSEQIEQVPRL
jgi:polyisoprenoid-binding protein YceI